MILHRIALEKTLEKAAQITQNSRQPQQKHEVSPEVKKPSNGNAGVRSTSTQKKKNEKNGYVRNREQVLASRTSAGPM